jgi:hypothetical protein
MKGIPILFLAYATIVLGFGVYVAFASGYPVLAVPVIAFLCYIMALYS